MSIINVYKATCVLQSHYRMRDTNPDRFRGFVATLNVFCKEIVEHTPLINQSLTTLSNYDSSNGFNWSNTFGALRNLTSVASSLAELYCG